MAVIDGVPPPRDAYLPSRLVGAFLDDLESLADSWNSLAVTYRLSPSGLWARVTNDDYSQRAEVLEHAALQLSAAITRFREANA